MSTNIKAATNTSINGEVKTLFRYVDSNATVGNNGTGNINNVTSTKQNYTNEIVIIASELGIARSARPRLPCSGRSYGSQFCRHPPMRREVSGNYRATLHTRNECGWHCDRGFPGF